MSYTLSTKSSFIIKKKSLVLECIYCLVKKIGLFKCSHISPFPIFLHTHLSIGPKNREVLRQTELNVTYKVPFTNLGKTTRSPPIATSLSRCACCISGVSPRHLCPFHLRVSLIYRLPDLETGSRRKL